MAQIKVVHTYDWHLGKRLYRKDREEEHLLFLNWLVDYLESVNADVLLIAGDVFDSPTPAHSALKNYYDFLKKVNDLGVQTVVISGNHDSQGLIAAPKNLLKDIKTHLFPRLETDLEKNICHLKINGNDLWIKSLPYFRNYELIKLASELEMFDEELVREEVFKNTLKRFFEYWPQEATKNKMLLSHHVFGDYAATGSEHFIGLSGIESVSIDWLRGNTDYAALGHIHKYQALSQEPPAIYTGSPLQMRFSESKQKHISTMIFDEGLASHEKVEIPVFRELVQVKTNSQTYESDIEKKLKNVQGELLPYVEVQMEMLESRTGMVDLVKELCTKLDCELLSFLPILKENDSIEPESIGANELNVVELFKRFYKEKYPESEAVPTYLEQHFKALIDESGDENS